MSANEHSEYAKVRSWYLARLRKRAIDKAAANQLTPAALIAADRERVEQLVLGKADQFRMTPRRSVITQRSFQNCIIGLWLAFIVVCLGWLFVLEGFDFGAASSTFFLLSLGFLCGQTTNDLFQSGLPEYFALTPYIILGWPLFWLVIAIFWSGGNNPRR